MSVARKFPYPKQRHGREIFPDMEVQVNYVEATNEKVHRGNFTKTSYKCSIITEIVVVALVFYQRS